MAPHGVSDWGDSTLVGVIMGCAAKQEADEEEGDGEETEEESETDNCDSS